jgi:hypothetical protein
MFLDDGRMGFEGGAEAARQDSGIEGGHAGKICRVNPVDKYKAGPGELRQRKPVEGFGRHSGRCFGRFQNRPERQLGERSDIGKTPVLVFEGGKAQFGKPGDAGLSQREQPRRLAAAVRLFETFERLDVRLGLFRGQGRLHRRHVKSSTRCVR